VDSEKITPRQQQVLDLIARGCIDSAIATQLHITRNTVKNHKRAIFDHLGVHNAAHAVAVAFELKLLPLTGPLAASYSPVAWGEVLR
jgi:LuxR family maltose regulon positive regulatory protein